MRLAIVLVVVSGCVPPSDRGRGDEYPYSDAGSGGGWTGSGGGPISYGCHQDTECGAQVCARDGACYAASNIRAAHVTWTIRGAEPTTASCATHPYLAIHFGSVDGAGFGYAPVSCTNGRFTVDKLPLHYTSVALGPESGSIEVSAAIDSSGDAAIDLP
jgi:hypothetical protein